MAEVCDWMDLLSHRRARADVGSFVNLGANLGLRLEMRFFEALILQRVAFRENYSDDTIEASQKQWSCYLILF